MSDLAMVNTRVYVIGQTVDPVLYYYADASKTINVSVYDINGSQVGTGTSYNLNDKLNTIYLGDYLSSLNLSEGYYTLKIGDFVFTIVAVNGAITTPTEQDGEIERIVVMHKPTGLMAELPKTAPVIPYSSNFTVVIYYHNNSKKLGKLVVYDGLNQYETDWVRKAILQFQVTFPDYNTMYQYLIVHLNTPTSNVAYAIGRIAQDSIEDAIKVNGLFAITPILGDVIDYKVDIDNKKLTYSVIARLGFGWDSVKRSLYAIIGGAVILGGVMGGIAIAGASGGVATVAGIAVAGAGISLGLYLLHKATSDSGQEEEKWMKAIRDTYTTGTQNITASKDTALGALDYWCQQGAITQEACNDLRQKILDLYNTSITVVKELYEQAKGCYEAGKKAGEKNKWLYAGGGALGGLVLSRIGGNKVILERIR